MIEKCILVAIVSVPFAGAAAGFFIGRKNEKARDIFNVLMTGAVFLMVVYLYPYIKGEGIELEIPDIMGTGLFLKLDAFRYLFLWITALVWFLATMYSTQYLIKYKNRNRYYSFFILTYASTLGIFVSENLLNLFTFFEIMSITSYFLIIHDEDEYTQDAGKTYLVMAIAGGLILLMGLFLLFDYTGTLRITYLPNEVMHLGPVKYVIAWLMIIGFGVKAGMMPLHVWLPKAHPAAPAPASAVLSGILLKTGVFGIMLTSLVIMKNDFAISRVIFVLGLANMFWGGLLAIFQRNIKRILAYSSMSQIGYILMGVGLIGMLGEHNNIAIYGTLFHIVNHAIFKVLLFMSAGIIYMVLHELSINSIRGFGKHKHMLKIMFFIGFMAIIGMPGFNGFISKNLLHEALIEAGHLYEGVGMNLAEFVFMASSSFTVVYLLKIFVAVFMESNEKYWGQFKEQVHKRAIVPLVALAGIVLYTGLKPDFVFNVIGQTESLFAGHGHVPRNLYTFDPIYNTGAIFVMGAGLYYFVVRELLIVHTEDGPAYKNPALKWFNLEEDLYKPVVEILYWGSSHLFKAFDRGLINLFNLGGRGLKAAGEIRIDVGRFKREKPKAVPRKREDFDLKELMNHSGENFAVSKVKESYESEMRSIGQLFSRFQIRMNSIIYALFIFAMILIGILGYLIFKS